MSQTIDTPQRGHGAARIIDVNLTESRVVSVFVAARTEKLTQPLYLNPLFLQPINRRGVKAEDDHDFSE